MSVVDFEAVFVVDVVVTSSVVVVGTVSSTNFAFDVFSTACLATTKVFPVVVEASEVPFSSVEAVVVLGIVVGLITVTLMFWE